MDDEFDRGRDGRSTDLPSGRGVPVWMGQNLNFCTRCGGPLRFGDVPGEEPINDAGEIVLIRRGIEPGRGSWAQPGGFLEVDETVNQAAIRETWEETGLLVEPGEIVGLYTRLEATVVTIVFEARITGGTARPTPEATEVVAFAPSAIPWSGIAFKTTIWALRDWIDLRHPGLRPGDGGWL